MRAAQEIKAFYLEGAGGDAAAAMAEVAGAGGFAVDVKTGVKRLAAETMRRMAKEEDKRVDGRTTRQVREGGKEGENVDGRTTCSVPPPPPSPPAAIAPHQLHVFFSSAKERSCSVSCAAPSLVFLGAALQPRSALPEEPLPPPPLPLPPPPSVAAQYTKS
jgi:hypothetical protein